MKISIPLLGNPPCIPPFRKGGWGWGSHTLEISVLKIEI